jgi:hypothetical protein
MEKASYTAERATEMGKDVTNRAQDLAHSTTDSNTARTMVAQE